TKLQAAVERAVVAFQVDHIDEVTASGWSVMAVGLAEEITEPEEIRAAEAMGLRPFATGDRTHFVKIRPEFLSGRRTA
ncbi:MAG TPA: pyridoxamine 5'-phosphate oxidase family protein, partial [Acidimicrobiia bacterium]|nr:pyridoxamine 5'-phosphate oxidase family protein [Acidimicrobiia bacterium]